MTKYTANLKLPYPEGSDAPKGDAQMQALADRIDAALGTAAWGNSPEGGTPVNSPDEMLIPLQVSGAAAAPQGFRLNDDGAFVVLTPGVYQASAFAYVTANNQPNLRWSLVISVDDGEPLAQFNQRAGDIPMVTGPVALAAGQVVGLKSANADASGSYNIFGQLFLLSSPLGLSGPGPMKLPYDLHRAGGGDHKP